MIFEKRFGFTVAVAGLCSMIGSCGIAEIKNGVHEKDTIPAHINNGSQIEADKGGCGFDLQEVGRGVLACFSKDGKLVLTEKAPKLATSEESSK